MRASGRILPQRGIFSRGRDLLKDQSYALWGLTQESLSRTLFPLAELTKAQVRILAGEMGLSTARKGESYEICFIPDNDYQRFLRERVQGLQEEVEGGEMAMNGEVVGRHRGFPFYTVGQRKGLGVAMGEPVYVTAIDPGRNRVEIGGERQLYRKGLLASSLNFIKYPDCSSPLRVQAKIRSMDKGGAATITETGDGSLQVIFDEERRAITAGQSVVFYEGEDVVGGGVIDRSLDS
jgi:tRNA-specific 2-thiouridylase